MGFALPSGVVNTDSAYFFADATLKLGPYIKQPDDQTLVVVDYTSTSVTLSSFAFTVDVSSNPQLVVSYPTMLPAQNVLLFLVSGGIVGQQYNISILVNGSRTDVLTVNIPSFGNCDCDTINPVPAIYSHTPLGTNGYVNTAVRLFWGNVAPANPNAMDQWYSTGDQTVYEWVVTGTTSLWSIISSPSYVFDAPPDGQLYSRRSTNWSRTPIQSDAPSDGGTYARQNAGWTTVNVSSAPSSTLPGMDGVAAIGVSATYARGDHIHPSDTSRYAADNPSGYQTAAQVAAIVPAASSSAPAMDSSASAGTNPAFSRGDHVHPSDTSRYAASNPSGYQTAAQVSASITASAYSLPTASTTVLGGVKIDGTTIHIASGVISSTASGGIPDAPATGVTFGRNNNTWIAVSGGGAGITDAPADGTAYSRNNAVWVHLAHTDITDWTATLAPYALTTSIPVASSTPPPMNGAASVGTLGTWARADHVHPTDTSLYPASNPSGYVTSAGAASAAPVQSVAGRTGVVTLTHTDITDWTATLTPYALAANVLPLTGGTLTGALTATSVVATSLVVQGPADLKVQAVTQAGTSLAINRSLGENCVLSLTASITGVTVSNWPAAGTTGKVRLVISNTGAFAISGWPTGTIWPGAVAPVITSGAGKKDIILLMSDDGGTTVYGSVVGQDYR